MPMMPWCLPVGSLVGGGLGTLSSGGLERRGHRPRAFLFPSAMEAPRLTRSFWIWLRSTNRAGVSVSRPPHWSGVEVLLVERGPPGKRYTWDRAVEVTPGLGAAGATTGDGATVSERKGQ